jgi:nicotinamidase-related amidase
MTDSIDAARSALLLMDFQNGVVAMLGDDAADPLLQRAQATIATARERGCQVAYVRVGFADGERPGGGMGSRLGDRLAEMHADAPATQIDARIAPQDGDIVVRKTRVGPFGTTDLDEQLRARGVDTLLMGGIATSGCVLSAVRDGYDRDYRIVVVADLCADREREIHDFLAQRIFPRQGEVVTAADLSALLR